MKRVQSAQKRVYPNLEKAKSEARERRLKSKAMKRRTRAMVNSWTGEWKYEKNTPEEKKCDLDRAADVITANGYRPSEITLEHLTERLVASAEEEFMSDENNSLYSGKNGSLNKEVFAEWLAEQAVSDYDYKG